MFSFTGSGSPFCGGSLIGNKWIVTAAHCLHEDMSDSEDSVLTSSKLFSLSTFQVMLGKHKTMGKDDTEQVFQAKNVILHPNYNSSTFQYDIALVELSDKAFLNDYVMPICLPDQAVETDEFVVVSGWGKQFLRRLPEFLMEIEIPVVNHALCKAGYKNLGRMVTDDMLCAGMKKGGMDACSGDSGGPMVTQSHQKKSWYLAGTVSWGVGCGEFDKYGVYSNVYKSLDWIKEKSGVKY